MKVLTAEKLTSDLSSVTNTGFNASTVYSHSFSTTVPSEYIFVVTGTDATSATIGSTFTISDPSTDSTAAVTYVDGTDSDAGTVSVQVDSGTAVNVKAGGSVTIHTSVIKAAAEGAIVSGTTASGSKKLYRLLGYANSVAYYEFYTPSVNTIVKCTEGSGSSATTTYYQYKSQAGAWNNYTLSL